jgi:hypothetical protein
LHHRSSTLYTRFPNMLGTRNSEMTMRPNPRSPLASPAPP